MPMNSPSSTPPRTTRLFLALMPNAAVRQRIDALVRRCSWCPGSQLYAAADWHVTLHFLGDVPSEQVGVIAAGVCLPAVSFQWALDRSQRWPKGLVVLSASVVPPPLMALHEALGEQLRALGQRVEARPYRPHLTLARRAESAEPVGDFATIDWPVRGFALVKSTGLAQRRYEVLQHWGAPPDTA